ncbi:hypothetical protein pb186bvf_002637 [Paramecium bursaria]
MIDYQMNDLNAFINDKSKVLLGQGAFGSVYKWTNNNQQELAVKVINGSAIKSQAQFNDLKNEINILKQIKSPNIVQIIEVQQTAGVTVFYLFMEYCDGGDLYTLLKREKKLNEDQVKKLIADLLNGYLQLLINQVIHRDLKPNNIVIHQNTFKIADFGFARYIENSENSLLMSALGTPEYASPQIINKEHYTTKSDIWSFGIILYQCLYGAFPFPENGQFFFFEQLKNNEFEYPKNVQVSQQLKDLISKCLVVEEENRISWQQLMKDPYVLQFFQGFVNLEKDIKQQEQLIIQALHKTYFNNIDVIFQKYDKSGQQKLNLGQFSQLITDINPQLQKYYIEYVYNNIVNQKTKQISKEELQIWLNKQLQDKNLQNLQKQEIKQDKPIPYAINQVLIPAMKRHKTDALELFDTFQEYKDDIPLGYMEFDAFQEILTQYMNNIQKHKQGSKNKLNRRGFRLF